MSQFGKLSTNSCMHVRMFPQNSSATTSERKSMINKLNAQIQNLNVENQYVKGLCEKIVALEPSVCIYEK